MNMKHVQSLRDGGGYVDDDAGSDDEQAVVFQVNKTTKTCRQSF